MINYTPASQLTFEKFTTPFEQHLREDNRWVKLAAIIPWDRMAAIYSTKLDQKAGRQCVDIRTVLAAIIIKHRLRMSDRETVETISENLYLQYFAGYPSFSNRLPFDASLFVDIRKRLGMEEFDKMTCLLLKQVEKAEQHDTNKKNRSSKQNRGGGTQGQSNDKPLQDKPDCHGPDAALPGKGKLKLDATVCDQVITYPTDLKLVNRAREESERIIDQLFAQLPLKTKPRTYRRKAREQYMQVAKNRNKTKSRIRKALGKQLRFLKRNLGHIEKLLDQFPNNQRFPLNHRDQQIYWVIRHLFAQQATMYKEKTRSCPDRIVNIYQPFVRPIVRGKDKNKVEFGAKIGVSEHDGFCRINHFSWDAYNECKDLIGQVEDYRLQYGYLPEVVLADRIYLNRENRKWLKEKGIRISGKPLGRPPKEQLTAYQKRKQQKERNQRNHIEAKFGQGKNGYGLNNIRAKRSDTSKSWISAIFFVMNLITYGKVMPGKLIFWLKQLIIEINYHVCRHQNENIMQMRRLDALVAN